jgi:hypothetical protein
LHKGENIPGLKNKLERQKSPANKKEEVNTEGAAEIKSTGVGFQHSAWDSHVGKLVMMATLVLLAPSCKPGVALLDPICLSLLLDGKAVVSPSWSLALFEKLHMRSFIRNSHVVYGCIPIYMLYGVIRQ